MSLIQPPDPPGGIWKIDPSLFGAEVSADDAGGTGDIDGEVRVALLIEDPEVLFSRYLAGHVGVCDPEIIDGYMHDSRNTMDDFVECHFGDCPRPQSAQGLRLQG